MVIGAFSISLSVKDIQVSKTFYETLGFQVFHGNIEQNWVIMKNGETVIGLFQGMFAGNILTFNPGWDQEGKEIDVFDDVRLIKSSLQSAGILLTKEIENTPSGPASIMLMDPDGNTILFDQHR